MIGEIPAWLEIQRFDAVASKLLTRLELLERQRADHAKRLAALEQSPSTEVACR